MKRIAFIAICLLGFTVAAHAQLTVNGLVIGDTYTLAQMKANLGNNPTFQSTSVSDDLGTTYTLEYEGDYFSFNTEYGLTNCTLETNTYPVVIDKVPLRVGDNISILLTIPDSQLVLREEGLYDLRLPPMDYCGVWIGFNSDNIITSIIFTVWM
jgi:hypothetical protein